MYNQIISYLFTNNPASAGYTAPDLMCNTNIIITLIHAYAFTIFSSFDD